MNPHIYDLLLQLGKSPKYPLAVDVGCGPELMSTVFLAPYFDKVLGVDISESQIEQVTLNNKHSNIEYRYENEKKVIRCQLLTVMSDEFIP